MGARRPRAPSVDHQPEGWRKGRQRIQRRERRKRPLDQDQRTRKRRAARSNSSSWRNRPLDPEQDQRREESRRRKGKEQGSVEPWKREKRMVTSLGEQAANHDDDRPNR